ncbi:MAG: hypothetical protein KGZ52_06610 [Xanthomonadaceae bacterium]|jgi:hypothetical protein|nr:hypothetical protein [Xanthomonadaceae bacterium]
MRFAFVLLLAATPSLALADWATVEGTVERVWEDGLSLKVGTDSVRVDTWAVCGDATPLHIRVGDQLRIEGDRELTSLDAARITGADGKQPCQGAEPRDEG